LTFSLFIHVSYVEKRGVTNNKLFQVSN